MKKFALLLAVALPLGFASCGDDTEDGFAIQSDDIEVKWDQTAQLSATESKDVTWMTDNDFIATVDKNGKVTANHVGSCTITASWKGETDQIKVTVIPANNDFIMPFIVWGKDAATVKATFKGFELDAANSTDTDLRYYTDLATFSYPAYQYLFDANGLYASTLLANYSNDDDIDALTDWLEQYYEYDDNADDILYTNGTQEVTIDVVDDDVFGAYWTKPATKAADYLSKAKAAASKMVKK